LLMALPCGLTPPDAACLASSITLAYRNLMVIDHAYAFTHSNVHSFRH